MPRSEWKEDYLGPYLQHYDDRGNKIGYSREKDDASGRYFQHYDEHGRKTGTSREASGFFGGGYTQHYDERGHKTGYSMPKSDLTGDPYARHYDERGRETGYTYGKDDPFGGRYAKTVSTERPARKRAAAVGAAAIFQLGDFSAFILCVIIATLLYAAKTVVDFLCDYQGIIMMTGFLALPPLIFLCVFVHGLRLYPEGKGRAFRAGLITGAGVLGFFVVGLLTWSIGLGDSISESMNSGPGGLLIPFILYFLAMTPILIAIYLFCVLIRNCMEQREYEAFFHLGEVWLTRIYKLCYVLYVVAFLVLDVFSISEGMLVLVGVLLGILLFWLANKLVWAVATRIFAHALS